MEFIRTTEEVAITFAAVPIAFAVQVKIFECRSNSIALYNNIADSLSGLAILVYNLYGVLVALGRNNVGFNLLVLAVVPCYGVRLCSVGYSSLEVGRLSCFYRYVFGSNYWFGDRCRLCNLEWFSSLNLAVATPCTCGHHVYHVGFVLC